MQRARNPMPDLDAPVIAKERIHTVGQHERLTIAVATDGSTHTQQAVIVAGHLARVLSATLKVLVTARLRSGAAYAQKLMQVTQALVHDLEPQPELIPLVGPTDEVIGNYVEAHAFDLLVMGAFQDRGAGSAAAIGAMAHHLLRYVSTSVLVVKRPTLHKLLACIASDDAPIVDLALRWTQALGAKLQFLHVLIPESEPPLQWSVTRNMPLNEILARGIYLQRPKHLGTALLLDDLLQQPTPVAHFLQETIDKVEAAGFDRHVLGIQQGKLTETIFAVEKAQTPDLVIIGRHSDPAHFVGSAADYVSSFAPHSVLVVHEGR
ncbi:MAG: universal stress protein [Caldilinea sp. CFX5]|nr:universal stress protein [Caldilinea sp. CFX5]